MEKLIQRTAIAVFLLVCGGMAFAQTQPWDENRITWTAPTTCTTGEPITACPITNYAVEHATSATGTFTWLTNVTGTSYSHTAVTAGVHCYRVIASSPNGASAPSNVACKTNTRPAGPPNPPVLTIAVVTGINHAPVYRMTSTGKRDSRYADACGFIEVGKACLERQTSFRDWTLYKVNPEDVKAYGTTCTGNLAAPCASSA